MNCINVEQCFEQIGAYFDCPKMGYFLIINTENYDTYQDVLQRIQADNSKQFVYASENCQPNGLPNVDVMVDKAVGDGSYVLVGLSQALMLRNDEELSRHIGDVLNRSISGRGLVLLEHCQQVLQKFIRQDVRLEGRVILMDGEPSPLPQIKLAKDEASCIGNRPLTNFKQLMEYLERISKAQYEKNPSVTVVSRFSAKSFSQAIYSVVESNGVYETLSQKYSDIAGGTVKTFGEDSQWRWLAENLSKHDSFSSLVCEHFGATVNLSSHIKSVMKSSNVEKKWLLWLSLKVFGEKSNQYLNLVLNRCNQYENFERDVYLELSNVSRSVPNFDTLYHERKLLIEQFPESLLLVNEYCETLGKLQKDEVFYLTDSNDAERHEFMRCLSTYDYSESELSTAVETFSKELSLYLKEYTFDSANTKLSGTDTSFRDELTKYFQEYKLQKLTNRIHPEFLETVNQYANSRPYNKLPPRSSIVSHMDRKNTQLFFFDALGVEHLAFIVAKCEEYGLVTEVSIGHCELPSITEINKEFIQYFDQCYKIDKLDEVKHNSQVYNYQKCQYPVHLFEELNIIDSELRNIQSMLVQGNFEQALLVSDHGASRLAVIYGHELDKAVKLENQAERSGRCCSLDTDPNIPYVAYDNGYAVMANYERFKGGRRANVEVHGGATLEEVLVPVVKITKHLDDVKMCFQESVITLKPREVPELVLYSNVSLNSPRLRINGEFYDGELIEDKKHWKFKLAKIKRKGDYSAEVYDGDKNLSITLNFKAQKKTYEVDMF